MHQGGVLRVRVGRQPRGETARLASVLPWLVVERARRVSQSTQRHAMTSARCASRPQGSLSRVPRRGWTVRNARSWQGLPDARTLSTERERHPADRHASGAIRSVAQSVSWHHARAGRRQERFLPAPKICKGLGLGWCPSIACMKYAQRAHACCTLARHGTRSTSGVRHLPQSSGDGGLRSVCRSAAIASRDVRPGRRSFDSRSLIPVRGWIAHLCRQV
jgi:hypothetical protein